MDIKIFGLNIDQWAIILSQYNENDFAYDTLADFVNARTAWRKNNMDFPNPDSPGWDKILDFNWKLAEKLLICLVENNSAIIGTDIEKLSQNFDYIRDKIYEQELRIELKKAKENFVNEKEKNVEITVEAKNEFLAPSEIAKKALKSLEEQLILNKNKLEINLKQYDEIEAKEEIAFEPMRGIPKNEYEDYLRWKKLQNITKSENSVPKEEIIRKLKI